MRPLVWLLLLIPGFCACQSGDLNFYIRFHDAHGLQSGDRVFLAGRETGTVEAIRPVEDGVWVKVAVRTLLRRQLTSGSRYTIETDPTTPDRQSIQIMPDLECQPLEEGAVVQGSEPRAGLFDPLLEGFGDSLKALQQEFQDLTGELEKLPKSPKLRDLERRLQELARQMQKAQGMLQQDVLPRLRQEMDRLREELEKAQPETPPAGGKAIDL